jgi:hypothetical protein
MELTELFHSNVAKLLYLALRARPDILVTVAFLTTRVSSPDIDDLGKLKRVMRYLRDTRNLALTLEASGDGAIRWWVDASFGVHPNMRSIVIVGSKTHLSEFITWIYIVYQVPHLKNWKPWLYHMSLLTVYH